MNIKLGRGVNLGNALEAPNEGEWGVTLEEEYFKLIAAVGFDTVRIPVRFSNHAAAEAPYTIEPVFFDRVDWAVQNALDNGLNAIVEMHHYLEIFEAPQDHTERFVGLWQQIATHFQNAPDSVYFELLNEPNTNLDADTWNELVAQTITVIRKTNPNRIIIVGPVDWYSSTRLVDLKLPKDDRNLIVSVHYYSPFHFTHQGAEWVSDSEPWLGTEWKGNSTEKSILRTDLRLTAIWGQSEDRPIFLGEFGAFSKADMASRARWTEFVSRTAEELGFSWAYWEFCSVFGVYDPAEKIWREPLLKALIPETP